VEALLWVTLALLAGGQGLLASILWRERGFEDRLGSKFDELESRLAERIDRLDAQLAGRFDQLQERLDTDLQDAR
jgi:hypothetical protein